MSLIIPANSASAAGGYVVDNSCRFNDDSSDYLNLSLGTPSNRKIFTCSAWVKRASTGTYPIFWFGADSNNWFMVKYESDSLRIESKSSGSTIIDVRTNALYRDFSAWYHVLVAVDTSQGTASNRIKIYVNGVQETSLQTSTYPNQNTDLNVITTAEIGNQHTTQYFDGYMAEVVFVDGTAQANTDLGEFDEDSGIWKPIDVSELTFGTNGFYLDFEDSANLGNDVNGNGADWTVNNLTAIDQTTDTPTNNFATLNPLVYSTGLTFSEGNCKLVTAGSSTSGGVGTMGMPSGKWYYEVKLGSDIDNHTHGIISEFTNTNQSGLQNKVGVTSWINGDGGEVVVDGTATTADYGLYTINQIMGIAVDVDNSTISYYRDGSALVTGFTISTTRGTLFPLIKMGINTTAEVNFGNPTFTISSGNTDGNGYGNFEYAPPSGYLSLCTANLSEVLG
jgi:hypothetical protein